MFPAGIRAAPFPAYAWLPPARLLLEPVNGSQTRYVDTRSPVEPIMGCFKLHQCFKQKWARSPESLAMWYKYKVLTHLRIRNMYIKADAGCPRHRGCGPYRHW